MSEIYETIESAAKDGIMPMPIKGSSDTMRLEGGGCCSAGGLFGVPVGLWSLWQHVFCDTCNLGGVLLLVVSGRVGAAT